MGQMFYSLSIAMGILVTFGSYMKKDVSIEDVDPERRGLRHGHRHHGGPDDHSGSVCLLRRRPGHPAGGACVDVHYASLKFLPAWAWAAAVGVLFFVLVLFAAVTSSIALTESAVSTFQDELGWSRRKATVLVGVIMVGAGHACPAWATARWPG